MARTSALKSANSGFWMFSFTAAKMSLSAACHATSCASRGAVCGKRFHSRAYLGTIWSTKMHTCTGRGLDGAGCKLLRIIKKVGVLQTRQTVIQVVVRNVKGLHGKSTQLQWFDRMNFLTDSGSDGCILDSRCYGWRATIHRALEAIRQHIRVRSARGGRGSWANESRQPFVVCTGP